MSSKIELIAFQISNQGATSGIYRTFNITKGWIFTYALLAEMTML